MHSVHCQLLCLKLPALSSVVTVYTFTSMISCTHEQVCSQSSQKGIVFRGGNGRDVYMHVRTYVHTYTYMYVPTYVRMYIPCPIHVVHVEYGNLLI